MPPALLQDVLETPVPIMMPQQGTCLHSFLQVSALKLTVKLKTCGLSPMAGMTLQQHLLTAGQPCSRQKCAVRSTLCAVSIVDGACTVRSVDHPAKAWQ